MSTDYQYVTDAEWNEGQDGGGAACGLAYGWRVVDEGYKVELSRLDAAGAFEHIASLRAFDGLGWRLDWHVGRAIPKQVVGDAFELLTDIASEIERRLEELQSVEAAPQHRQR